MNAIITWIRANAWEWALVAWKWISWAVVGVWTSFVALIKSPAAWLACTLLFVVGFSTGYIVRSDAVRDIKMELSTVQHKKAEVDRDLVAAQRKVRSLVEQVEALDKKLKEAATPAVEAPKPKKKTSSTRARRL